MSHQQPGSVVVDHAVSNIRVVDGRSLLDERVLSRIIHEVLAAMDRQRELRDRADAERRVTRGVSHEVIR